jgi:hypothetical protein
MKSGKNETSDYIAMLVSSIEMRYPAGSVAYLLEARAVKPKRTRHFGGAYCIHFHLVLLLIMHGPIHLHGVVRMGTASPHFTLPGQTCGFTAPAFSEACV